MCFYYKKEQIVLLRHFLLVKYSFVLSKEKPDMDISVKDHIALVGLVSGFDLIFKNFETKKTWKAYFFHLCPSIFFLFRIWEYPWWLIHRQVVQNSPDLRLIFLDFQMLLQKSKFFFKKCCFTIIYIIRFFSSPPTPPSPRPNFVLRFVLSTHFHHRHDLFLSVAICSDWRKSSSQWLSCSGSRNPVVNFLFSH